MATLPKHDFTAQLPLAPEEAHPHLALVSTPAELLRIAVSQNADLDKLSLNSCDLWQGRWEKA